MNVTGKIIDTGLDIKTGQPKITILLNEKHTFLTEVDDLIRRDKLSVSINPHREKRSKDANAYCWTLCEKLADKLGMTKKDVYRREIKEVGVFKDFHFIDPDDSVTIRSAWERLGTGWVTEQVDFEQDGNTVCIRCYYGSSLYNTRQMSRLLNNLIQDCREQGIDTITPDEKARMLAAWENR